MIEFYNHSLAFSYAGELADWMMNGWFGVSTAISWRRASFWIMPWLWSITFLPAFHEFLDDLANIWRENGKWSEKVLAVSMKNAFSCFWHLPFFNEKWSLPNWNWPPPVWLFFSSNYWLFKVVPLRLTLCLNPTYIRFSSSLYKKGVIILCSGDRAFSLPRRITCCRWGSLEQRQAFNN